MMPEPRLSFYKGLYKLGSITKEEITAIPVTKHNDDEKTEIITET